MERGESVVCCAEEETLSAQATPRGTRGQVAPLRLSTSTFQPSGLLFTRPEAPDTYLFLPSLMVDPSVTQIHPLSDLQGKKYTLPSPKLLLCPKDVTFMPKPQGSPSADFRGFLVGLLYPWLVGVNSPVSPSWGLLCPLSASTYRSATFTWPTPKHPLPVRAPRAAGEAKTSSSPPDFQLSRKRAARPVSVWAVVLHLSNGLCFFWTLPLPPSSRTTRPLTLLLCTS